MKKRRSVFSLVCMVVFFMTQIITLPAFGEEIQTSLMGNAEPYNIERQINQEFTVNYKVNPEKISSKDINNVVGKEKEIVLVIDTSGSMNDTIYGKQKLQTMKEVAKKFIYKFKKDEKVKIGLVEYNTEAKINSDLVGKDNFDSLNTNLYYLNANGSTNIGDGFRKAYHMLKKGSHSADKYIILMTDGAPTSYVAKYGSVNFVRSYGSRYHNDKTCNIKENVYCGDGYEEKGYLRNYNLIAKFSYIVNKEFEKEDTNSVTYVSYYNKYSSQYNEDALSYSKNMAKIIADDKSINTDIVGFGYGLNSKALNEIANSAGTNYIPASNEYEINNIYTKIANKIDSSMSAQIKFSMPIPEGLEVTKMPQGLKKDETGKNIIGNLGFANYFLINGYYKADSVNFSINFKAVNKDKATYKLEGNKSKASYKMPNKEYVQNFNDVNIIIKNKEALKSFLKLNQSLVEKNKKDYKVGETFNLSYKIDKSNGISKDMYDELYKKDKEIVLVVDTSGSMDCLLSESTHSKNSRLEAVKRVANNFIDKIQKNNNENNIKIGVVSYSTKGNKNTNITNNFGIVKNSINKLTAQGGTNIGDGIRKAYNMLEDNKDIDKYIILMTDGFPTAFTSYENYLNYTKPYYKYEVSGEILKGKRISYFKDINKYSFKLNNDNLSEAYVVNYGNNDYKGLSMKYSLEAANEARSKNINNFVVGFSDGINSEKLNRIAYNSGGYYEEAKDEKQLNDIYDKIADEIKLPTVKDIKYQLNMPDGLIAEEITNLSSDEIQSLYIDDGGKRVVGVINNVNYSRIQDGKYVVDKLKEDNVNFTVKVKGSVQGDYTLNDAYITYTDVDGSKTKKTFTPEIKLSISEKDAIVEFEKLGLFLKKPNSNHGIDKYLKTKDISLFNGLSYKLGSVLKIGYENESEKGKIVENNTNIKISTVFNGKTDENIKNIQLYHFDSKKGKLEKVDITILNGEITISSGKLTKGEKYILTQDFIPNNKGKLTITNNILVNKKNKLTKDLSVKFIETLPDVE